jgi:hypothetical protein
MISSNRHGAEPSALRPRRRAVSSLFSIEMPRIAIAVGPLHLRTESTEEALNQTILRLDVETAVVPDRHTAQVSASFLARCDDSFHPIAGLKAEETLVAPEVAAWKSVLRQRPRPKGRSLQVPARRQTPRLAG